ncbi:hypothetical protein Plhal304r1_c003g0012851 [Plasmopara halstedii]
MILCGCYVRFVKLVSFDVSFKQTTLKLWVRKRDERCTMYSFGIFNSRAPHITLVRAFCCLTSDSRSVVVIRPHDKGGL